MNNFRRRVLGGKALLPGEVIGSDAKALDVVFSKNDGSELVIISGLENWPDSGYTPIGIVVVPGTHDRYEDGSCGVMSLVCMDLDNPENGANPGTLKFMYFGLGSNTFDKIGNYMYTGYNSSIKYIPYQMYTDTWYMNSTSRSNTAFWPYLGQYNGDESVVVTLDFNLITEYNNGDYVTSTSGHAILDFNGIRNTAACYTFSRNSDSQWTSSTVTNNNRSFPGVICTARFKTIGTKSFLDVYGEITQNNINYGTPISSMKNTGFWYIPGCGEISYCAPILTFLELTFRALNQKYGTVTFNSFGFGNESSCIATSTESATDIFVINEYGSIRTIHKYNNARFFAFMRL